MRNILKLSLAIYFLGGVYFKSSAQQATNLTLPNTPAFSILDFEPSAVMKPTSNKDLGADLLNSFDKNGKLLMNLGMEVSPYWLKSNPTLSREAYLNPTIGQCFKQSFNVSAATVRDSAKGENKLGLGFRFKLVNGKPVDSLAIKANEFKNDQTMTAAFNAVKPFIGSTITTRQQAIDFIVQTLKSMNFDSKKVNDFITYSQKKASSYTDSPDGIKNFVEGMINELLNSDASLIQEIALLSKKRVGFILEFAGASSFITNASVEPVEKVGFWINASNYMSPTSAWTATGRYLYTSKDSTISSADLGLSYVKELSNINISIEGMARWYHVYIPDVNLYNQPIKRVEEGFTYRLAVQGSYKIASNISVNLSFGKNFDSPLTVNYSFFSIFGINYSLYKPVKVNPSQ